MSVLTTPGAVDYFPVLLKYPVDKQLLISESNIVLYITNRY